jgi:hypothetical protein
MLGYFDVFPDKTRTELRTATFENGNADDPLPGGTFVFTEFFCTDPKCDCQRVLVKVFRAESEDARAEEVATISYCWNPDSDDIWSAINSETSNPFLDPFHRQASYASELLDFWTTMIERDKVYALRVQRHYNEIRAEIGQTTERRGRRHSTKHKARGISGRPLTKRNRKLHKQRLARARKR